jgi:hypothetical protein
MCSDAGEEAPPAPDRPQGPQRPPRRPRAATTQTGVTVARDPMEGFQALAHVQQGAQGGAVGFRVKRGDYQPAPDLFAEFTRRTGKPTK